MLITPTKIYEDFRNNILDKHSAVNILISLIENSNNNIIRTESIGIIDEIGYRHDKIFRLFENLLISDSNKGVRIAAANAIYKNFLGKALSPMMWTILNETSLECLNIVKNSLTNIIKTLLERDDSFSKAILIKEIKKISNQKFNDNLYDLINDGQIKEFSSKELAQVLIDYITISFLKKQFQRLNFELENGIVKKLDLRFRYYNKSSELISPSSPLKIPIIKINELDTQAGSIIPLSSCKELHLSYNSLEELPNWIKSLSSLESIFLHGNRLTELPDWIGSLSSLKKIGLSGNNLSSLPKCLLDLSSLTYLGLSENNLKYVPEWLGSLTSLERLWLDNNHILSLPESLKSLSSLKSLYLGNNNLKILPEIFESFNSLKALWLEGNSIEKLPESIGSLSSLEYLYLNDNKINVLPKSISKLSSLKFLHLNNNMLMIIPESLERLSSLKEIWLKGNNLKEIPDSVKELKERGISVYI